MPVTNGTVIREHFFVSAEPAYLQVGFFVKSPTQDDSSCGDTLPGVTLLKPSLVTAEKSVRPRRVSYGILFQFAIARQLHFCRRDGRVSVRCQPPSVPATFRLSLAGESLVNVAHRRTSSFICLAAIGWLTPRWRLLLCAKSGKSCYNQTHGRLS